MNTEIMNANDNWASRPTHIKGAAALLALYLALGFTNAIVRRMPTHPAQICATAAFLGVMLLWIWLIYRGTNWARWLFLAWFAWNLFFAPWHAHWRLAELQALFCVQTCLQLGGTCLVVPSRRKPLVWTLCGGCLTACSGWEPAVQLTCNSCVSDGWLPPLMLSVGPLRPLRIST